MNSGGKNENKNTLVKRWIVIFRMIKYYQQIYWNNFKPPAEKKKSF